MQLEVAIATLSSDLRNHVLYCEARMRVLWKLATVISGAIALVVSLVVTLLKP